LLNFPFAEFPYPAPQRTDPEAVYMMQGWLFHNTDFWSVTRIEAYLSGISNDSMIILDLDTEAWPVWTYTSGFFGKVKDFGGRWCLGCIKCCTFVFPKALDLEFVAQFWW